MIGYLSLGRDTFDIKYAKQKIYNISKILKKLDYKISEFKSCHGPIGTVIFFDSNFH